MLASCGLPNVGPNKKEIFAGSVQQDGDAFIIEVNDHVTRSTAVVPALGFSQALQDAPQIGADRINPGDTISVNVWENVDDQLLGAQGPTTLEVIQVDGLGNIFVPYAGRLKAAGKSPEQLRRLITDKLKEQTPDPQVEVRREAGDGATVSVSGTVASQGVYAIERPTRTVSAMIARAGGVTVRPEVAQISLLRGTTTSQAWYLDLFNNPGMDIPVRNGDRLLIEADRRSFTALGATGTQNRVPFDSQTLSAIDAIAQVGGLQSNSSDPTGVFVFRNEPLPIAQTVLNRNDLAGPQRMAYVLDLTKPNGIFLARDFVIRDGDTLYVTEAPFTQWSKTIAALTGSLTAINTIQTTAIGK